ncbi:hypothetical protein L873DRAFT_762850 [Choiromyces venosus 120613-1]|uniref:Uncharacterized protein n=1 Tax=Choiromyces venosus 120613-1 TaxID=1336337 RepID=A0A3N4JQV4_9PEZI|nr:hypothetical protein L873DRAFT_762850 [Choiromyces venosus 120613-1]
MLVERGPNVAFFYRCTVVCIIRILLPRDVGESCSWNAYVVRYVCIPAHQCFPFACYFK